MNTRIKLLIIFLIAFSMRLAVNYAFQGLNSPPDPNAGIDHINYEELARSIASGQGYMFGGGTNTYIAPGMPFLIAMVYKLFGINYFAVRVMFCLLGAATCLVIFMITRRLSDERVALGAALALAAYPMHVHFSQHFLSEVPWGFFMVLAIACALKTQETGKWIYGALFGTLVGITAYIRPVSMLYFPLFFVLLLFYYHPPRKELIIKYFLLPLAFFTLTIAPWTVRNYIVTKHFVAMTTNGGFTFWDGNNQTRFQDSSLIGSGDTDIAVNAQFQEILKIPDPFAREQAAYQAAFDTIKGHIGELPRLEMMKLYRLLTPFYGTGNKAFDLVGGLSWAILMPFAFIGMVSSARDRRYLPIHALVVMTVVVTLIWFGSYRYREAIGPFLVLYGAVGFHWLLDITLLKRKKVL